MKHTCNTDFSKDCQECIKIIKSPINKLYLSRTKTKGTTLKKELKRFFGIK